MTGILPILGKERIKVGICIYIGAHTQPCACGAQGRRAGDQVLPKEKLLSLWFLSLCFSESI